ncbi:MAG: helix-turn-helix domain-containing protein [Terriglobia bacterium]
MSQTQETQTMTHSVESPLLTVTEAAMYLKISAWTLRHWVSKHKIIFVKYNGNGSVRFRRRDLDRFIAQNVNKDQDNGNCGSQDN